jgi:hypothetical protein
MIIDKQSFGEEERDKRILFLLFAAFFLGDFLCSFFLGHVDVTSSRFIARRYLLTINQVLILKRISYFNYIPIKKFRQCLELCFVKYHFDSKRLMFLARRN